ncbi:MAG TPA: SLBB domain-containing protein, partial [Chitinophagaceae bacterium]
MHDLKGFLLSLLIIATTALLIATPVKAQNTLPPGISQMNFSTLNVDNLTDDQVRQFMQEVQKSGMSDAQVDQVALAKGMSVAELQKLKDREAKIRAAGNGVQTQVQDTLPGNYNAQPPTFTAPPPVVPSAAGPKIFGQELFRNPHMSFEPNLNIPTPKNYQVGPGDEMVVDIYGYSEANYRLLVSKEGSINIPYIGIVYVNGLTIDEAAAKIKAKLSVIYSGIRTGKTSVQVGIGRIRGMKVTLLGEVVKPGTYTLPSLATVFNALYASGGPAENGSFRDIEVVRNNAVIDTVDVYDFLMKGDQSKNIRLQDQDVIRIPVYKTHVEIAGQVKRPGIYEMQPGESLDNLLRFAGGFTDSAYTALAKVVQITDKEKKISDIPSAEFGSFTPHTGDQYYIGSILDRFTNRVTINGAVYRPGQFQLTDGLTLSQLIKKADGLREDAFLPRGYIMRQNPDLTSSVVQFDAAKIMDGSQPDIVLQKEDVVQVYSIFDLRDQYQVSINGEVRNAGDYKYADSMTLEDLILQAGGFKEGATPQRIEISRRMMNSDPRSASAKIAQVYQVNVDKDLAMNAAKFILHPFDIVVVRSSPGYEVQKQVRVDGEVLYPGLYTITAKNERISDLVKRAGGLTALAYPEGASLQRIAEMAGAISKEQKLRLFQRFQHASAADTAGITDSLLQQQVQQNDHVGINLDKILKDPGSKYDLFLENGDVLNVPKQLQTVQVNGEVLYPVTTPYKGGRRVRYYISQAGGFGIKAKKRRVYVVYANG